jgi:hypothetical protein
VRCHQLAAAVLGLAIVPVSDAAVTEFASLGDWASGAGAFTEIGFDELPEWTVVTDQYNDSGVLFPGLDVIQPSQSAFPIDGFGLSSVEGLIDMEFVDPISAFAIHFPGIGSLRIWAGSEILAEIPFFGGSGGGNFIGFTFDVPVTRVEMIEPFPPGDVNIDQLYFTVIPAPAALPLLCVGLIRGRRRR